MAPIQPGEPAQSPEVRGPADAMGGYVATTVSNDRTIMGLPQSIFFTLLTAFIVAVFGYGVLTANVNAIGRDNERQDSVMKEVRDDIKQMRQQLLELIVTLKGPR